MSLYNLTPEQVEFIQTCIEHKFPLSSDAPECGLADETCSILQDPNKHNTVYSLVWNGTTVFVETDEVKFVQYLKDDIGMNDHFIEDHMNGGSYDITFSDELDEDDPECVVGWKWTPDVGDDYVTIELSSNLISKQ